MQSLGLPLLYLPLRVEHMRSYSWPAFRRQSITHGRGVMRWEAKTNKRVTSRTRILLRAAKRALVTPAAILRFGDLRLATVHTMGELFDAYGQWLEWPELAET